VSQAAECLLLSVKEAANILHMGRTSLQRRITSGHIRFVRMGRLVRIPSDEIERVLREGLPVMPVGRPPN
jgi:excisionase family DNA binding protein